MFKICLHRALWPAVQKLPSGLKHGPEAVVAKRLQPGTRRHAPGCWMGTHGRNEPLEPLNSPRRAKEFIYRLHPNERKCLLVELQSFESKAIAQGKKLKGWGKGGSLGEKVAGYLLGVYHLFCFFGHYVAYQTSPRAIHCFLFT